MCFAFLFIVFLVCKYGQQFGLFRVRLVTDLSFFCLMLVCVLFFLFLTFFWICARIWDSLELALYGFWFVFGFSFFTFLQYGRLFGLILFSYRFVCFAFHCFWLRQAVWNRVTCFAFLSLRLLLKVLVKYDVNSWEMWTFTCFYHFRKKWFPLKCCVDLCKYLSSVTNFSVIAFKLLKKEPRPFVE